MILHVKCFATLEPFQPAGPAEVPDRATAAGAARTLGLPLDEVAIVFVNGAVAELDAVLSDGDEVKFFPVVGGG